MSISNFLRDPVTLIKRDGQRFDLMAGVQPKKIFIADINLPIEEGDTIERILPNELTEKYIITNAHLWQGHGQRPYYECAVRKETKLAPEQRLPSSVVYNVSGTGARVNINSADSSVNVVTVNSAELFEQLASVLETQISNERERTELLERLRELQEAKGNSTYLEKYQRFIAAAANHIQLLAPFLPALTQFLGT